MMMMMMIIIMIVIIALNGAIRDIIITLMMMTTTAAATIALKGANRNFYNLLTAPRIVSNTCAQVARAQSRVQITCNTSSAYREKHVACRVVRRDSSAIKFGRVEFTFILATFYWLNPLTDGGGEETGVPRENP